MAHCYFFFANGSKLVECQVPPISAGRASLVTLSSAPATQFRKIGTVNRSRLAEWTPGENLSPSLSSSCCSSQFVGHGLLFDRRSDPPEVHWLLPALWAHVRALVIHHPAGWSHTAVCQCWHESGTIFMMLFAADLLVCCVCANCAVVVVS